MKGSNWPRSLFLVRHGETIDVNSTLDQKMTAVGWTPFSCGLSDLGVKQAQNAGKYITHRLGGAADAYYHSPYSRAAQTMDELVGLHGQSFEDGRLAEVQRGLCHLLSPLDLAHIMPWEAHRKDRDPIYFYRPLGGENWQDAETRLGSFIQSLRMDHAGEHVVAVTHAHAIILLRRLLDRTPIEDAMLTFKAQMFVPHGSVTVYEFGREKPFAGTFVMNDDGGSTCI